MLGIPTRRNHARAAALLALAAMTNSAGDGAVAAEAAARVDSLGWHNELIGSLNFTQSSFSNWAAGGVDNSSWLLGGRGSFKRLGVRANWSNVLCLEYGEVKEKDRDSRKASDLIFAESIVDFNTSRLIKPYARASLKTQFAAGYDYAVDPKLKVSDFADPLYLSQGAGVGLQIKPYVITRFGLGLQETYADEFAAIYTDDHDTPDDLETSRIEGGLESVTELDKTLHKQLALKSRLALFWAFNNSDQIDVDWMTDINLKAMGALGMTLKFELLYNKDVLDKIQWQQVLGIGVTYSFL
ncbi:MAG: DUF3078 domain-containing protein [Candidatus Krumholzibacteriia bacterium]